MNLELPDSVPEVDTQHWCSGSTVEQPGVTVSGNTFQQIDTTVPWGVGGIRKGTRNMYQRYCFVFYYGS